MAGTVTVIRDYWGTGSNVSTIHFNIETGHIKCSAQGGSVSRLRWVPIQTFVDTLKDYERIAYDECCMSDEDTKTLVAYDTMRGL